ncbi:unnamed protein product [Toxocara canis]|uniref:Uncharacterized protein n=1 Tax=Toxocara canis TaxID=6265 RepID=A0A183VG40_TOXCA|nr:unnamed protein product [Toxocara canis]
MQEAIHVLRQKEDVYDPYAKLRNITGIVCIVFILLCIFYTVWDIAARLFDCLKNPTPKYLPSNPAVTTKSTPPHQHLLRPPPPSRHVSSSLCGNSYAAMDTLDAPARSAVKPARFISKEGPPSEAPIDDLVNTVEKYANQTFKIANAQTCDVGSHYHIIVATRQKYIRVFLERFLTS